MASEYSSQSRRNRLLAVLTPADNSERRIAVVITTGYRVDRGQPDLGKAVAILQKPHADSDLINAIQKATVAAFPPMIGFRMSAAGPASTGEEGSRSRWWGAVGIFRWHRTTGRLVQRRDLSLDASNCLDLRHNS